MLDVPRIEAMLTVVGGLMVFFGAAWLFRLGQLEADWRHFLAPLEQLASARGAALEGRLGQLVSLTGQHQGMPWRAMVLPSTRENQVLLTVEAPALTGLEVRPTEHSDPDGKGIMATGEGWTARPTVAGQSLDPDTMHRLATSFDRVFSQTGLRQLRHDQRGLQLSLASPTERDAARDVGQALDLALMVCAANSNGARTGLR
jgi:hypothetical protein